MAEPVWLAKAKTLAAGQSSRIQCCSADRSMIITNDRKGYRGYCFRCKEPVFEPHGEHSLATLLRRKAEFEIRESREVALPNDFTLDIPPEDATWIFKAGIDSELAKHYGIGYSPSLSRVIVPVYLGTELQAFTARAKYGKPKYFEKSIDPSSTIFVADPQLLLPSYRQWALSDGPDCVFVEDNLSAIRVGRVAKHVVSLMGTSANAKQLTKALNNHRDITEGYRPKVHVWLDGDGPGRTASRKLCDALRLLGYEVKEIVTNKDPKMYSYRTIKEQIT